ncbi:uncharacterized protein FIBRA_04915 [Fibroporia radiculosa]|uniref:Serine protease n=1 Tax=Fibroporia radiculosa TaxID=599839 RepID=J4H379_9APHY|nr:uncharacterized protein FIBRA_04915 [Fibroporia radiculosa]CCM02804.1 predicted protein [Fibroporia radiculosa]
MALQRCGLPAFFSACHRGFGRRVYARAYAAVGSTTYVGQPPPPPSPSSSLPTAPPTAPNFPSVFDARILSELRHRAQPPPGSTSSVQIQLPQLIDQYLDRSGLVLDSALSYESRPASERQVLFDENGDDAIAMIVHAAQQAGVGHKVTHASGFALNVPGLEGQSVFVTCAHTLEEIRHSRLLRSHAEHPSLSGSFIVTGSSSPTFSPVSSVLSSLYRSDLLLLSTSTPVPLIRTLPVSPYPAQPGTPIRVHFVAEKPQICGADAEGWRPWIDGTWSKWVRGTLVGYRDLAGREAKPGTYDALSHLIFDPPPTPGSSGGPIIDEQSGAVVGVMLGTQMQNRVEGVRGWGVPSELIFEMFSLPGLKLTNKT